jgi:hypothetical protein|tara:strand:- start:961 stop:1647 length:687 start_codon:yes stop_codon:yes gene_type:complete
VLVCNKFVFLHLHKSGGTFVTNLMSTCIPYTKAIGYHLPYRMLPSSYRRHPVIGTVRNPWSYYVSWYHFQKQIKNPNALFMAMSNNKTLTFEQTITNLLTISDNEKLFQIAKNSLPLSFDNHGLNITQACILPVYQTGIGFYSFLYSRLYEDCYDINIIEMENLRNGLEDVLAKLNVEPKQKIKTFIQKSPVINTSNHKPYQSYYSATLKKLVAKRDELLIESHQYSF